MSLTPQSDFPVGCNRIAGCSFPSINGYPGTILHPPPPPPPERLYKFGTPPRRRRASLSRAIYHYTVFPPIAGPPSPFPPRVHIDPPRGRRPSFSTVSGDMSNSNETGKTVSRHVLFYSFRKRNTHSRRRRRPRTNRLVSSSVPVQLRRVVGGGTGEAVPTDLSLSRRFYIFLGCTTTKAARSCFVSINFSTVGCRLL